MGYLGRETILKAEDLQTREVHVPEWRDPDTGEDTVLVRALSGTDRDAYQASMMQVQEGGQMAPELGNLTAKLVARVIVDEDGQPLFNELDVGRLGQKSSAALVRVYEVATEMSGISGQSTEVAAGNSGAAPSGDSTSS